MRYGAHVARKRDLGLVIVNGAERDHVAYARSPRVVITCTAIEYRNVIDAAEHVAARKLGFRTLSVVKQQSDQFFRAVESVGAYLSHACGYIYGFSHAVGERIAVYRCSARVYTHHGFGASDLYQSSADKHEFGVLSVHPARASERRGAYRNALKSIFGFDGFQRVNFLSGAHENTVDRTCVFEERIGN